jgi:hypothetical protein
MPNLYRTFIQLDENQREFLRGLQKAWVLSGAAKKPPPMSTVIRAIIADYESMLLLQGEPDFRRALGKISGNPQ